MTPRRYAAGLTTLGVALAAANWYLRPERAVAWLAALAMFGAMALALALTGRAGHDGAKRSGADAIAAGAIFAGLILAFTLGSRLAAALGAPADTDFAHRATMVILGGFFVATGNAMPKTLTPLSAKGCAPAKNQAIQRFVGWTWVLGGLAFAAAWLALPLAQAEPVSMLVLIAAMLTTIGRVFVWRGAPQRPA